MFSNGMLIFKYCSVFIAAFQNFAFRLLGQRSKQREQQFLVTEFKNLEAPLVQAVRRNDATGTQYLLERIKYVWSELFDVTLDIWDKVDSELESEQITFQENLKATMARLLYIGG